MSCSASGLSRVILLLNEGAVIKQNNRGGSNIGLAGCGMGLKIEAGCGIQRKLEGDAG